jgi:hypothetical protein
MLLIEVVIVSFSLSGAEVTMDLSPTFHIGHKERCRGRHPLRRLCRPLARDWTRSGPATRKANHTERDDGPPEAAGGLTCLSYPRARLYVAINTPVRVVTLSTSRSDACARRGETASVPCLAPGDGSSAATRRSNRQPPASRSARRSPRSRGSCRHCPLSSPESRGVRWVASSHIARLRPSVHREGGVGELLCVDQLHA